MSETSKKWASILKSQKELDTLHNDYLSKKVQEANILGSSNIFIRELFGEWINHEKEYKEKLQQENQDFEYFLKTGRVMPRKGDIIDFKGHKAEVLYVGMGMIELGYNGSSGTFNLNEVWG